MEKYKYGDMNVPIFNWGDDADFATLQQARDICDTDLPFHHMALMPDCHLGYGLCIGGVVATKDVIVPNFVGLDIGCGVVSVKLRIKEITRGQIQLARYAIKDRVPTGFTHQKRAQRGDLMPYLYGNVKVPYIVGQEYESARKQIGTLGGGNHFIEIQRGSDGYIYLMIHSGSRNLGNKVAKHYHSLAIEKMEKYHVNIKKDLSFLSLNTTIGQDYLAEMNYCVEFAKASRKLMLQRCIEVMEEICGFGSGSSLDVIDVAHNYAVQEHHYGQNVWVHRKGATRAYEGDIGLIPGSQGTNSYIVEGLGNPESFKSCSHGAGRTMSRTKAKTDLNLEEEQKKLDDLGIIHDMRSVGKLDESVGSYKNIETVMSNQKDLVKIKTTLTPLGSIKA